MNDMMNFFEKLGSLLNSRRFWLLVAQAAVVLVTIAGLVAPIIGQEIDTSNLPDAEALADRLMAYVEKIAALVLAIGGVLKLIGSVQQTINGYTERPAGVRDRG